MGGATPDAIDVEKIPDIKVDQDLADILAKRRFMKAVGQKAGQSVTGSPMPYQTNARLVEKKAQDAGPDSDDEFGDEDQPGEPSHKLGFEETGGASKGGG